LRIKEQETRLILHDHDDDDLVICLDVQRKNAKDFGEITWLISQKVKWETPRLSSCANLSNRLTG